MIVISGTVKVRPDRREAAIAAALRVAEATRAEPGCLAYRFATDLADPMLFLIFEEWESDEALARHFETAHLKAFRAEMPGLVAGPPAIRRYVVTSAGPL
jgi:quinol monooxygenase YgiN